MIQSVERAGRILELFLANETLTLTQISQSMQLPMSTTAGLVSTLESLSFLEQEAYGRRYRLGHKLFQLGSCYRQRINLKRIAHPYLVELCKQTNLTVNLSKLVGRNVLYLDNVAPRGIVELATREGMLFPAHCTATGKALLAAKTDEEIRELYSGAEFEVYTENTVHDIETLIEEMEYTRRAGYAIDYFESDANTFGYAMAITDAYGETPCAISTGGLSFQKGDGVVEGGKLAALRATVTEIAHKLGD